MPVFFNYHTHLSQAPYFSPSLLLVSASPLRLFPLPSGALFFDPVDFALPSFIAFNWLNSASFYTFFPPLSVVPFLVYVALLPILPSCVLFTTAFLLVNSSASTGPISSPLLPVIFIQTFAAAPFAQLCRVCYFAPVMYKQASEKELISPNLLFPLLPAQVRSAEAEEMKSHQSISSLPPLPTPDSLVIGSDFLLHTISSCSWALCCRNQAFYLYGTILLVPAGWKKGFLKWLLKSQNIMFFTH